MTDTKCHGVPDCKAAIVEVGVLFSYRQVIGLLRTGPILRVQFYFDIATRLKL